MTSPSSGSSPAAPGNQTLSSGLHRYLDSHTPISTTYTYTWSNKYKNKIMLIAPKRLVWCCSMRMSSFPGGSYSPSLGIIHRHVWGFCCCCQLFVSGVGVWTQGLTQVKRGLYCLAEPSNVPCPWSQFLKSIFFGVYAGNCPRIHACLICTKLIFSQLWICRVNSLEESVYHSILQASSFALTILPDLGIRQNLNIELPCWTVWEGFNKFKVTEHQNIFQRYPKSLKLV